MVNRGTKRAPATKAKKNISGKGFASHLNKIKEAAKDIFIHTGRGTGKVKLGDIADSKGYDNKGDYVSTGRGTKRVKRK